MGALATLNISSNGLNNGGRGLQELCPAIAASKITCLDVSNTNASMNGGTAAIVDMLKNNGAMTRLDISKSKLGDAGTKALAEGLKSNQIMAELNISSNGMGKLGAIALADIIPGMGALSKLIFGGDGLVHDGNDHVSPAPATLELGRAKANFSNKNLGAGGAIIIAAWIAHQNNGTLLVLLMKRNNLGTKEAGEVLGDMLNGNSVLKELDLSNNFVSSRDGGDSTAFAQGISKGLPDNGALIKLDISMNGIKAEQEGDLPRICVASGIELVI
jgi:hypothetical protein